MMNISILQYCGFYYISWKFSYSLHLQCQIKSI